MKDPAALVADITRRLDRTWAAHLSGDTPAWPHRFSLGSTTKTTLETGWQATYQPRIREWQQWATTHPITLHTEAKRVYTTLQQIPVAATIHTIDDAATLASTLAATGWAHRIWQARTRAALLDEKFPDRREPTRLLKRITGYTDLDFDLLLTVADWFTRHDSAGLTPRQVPIPGVHAKWLNTHQPDILALTGRNTLGLLPPHPARIHFTYLDPDYRATGARTHDSATVGDNFTPPYAPRVVVISENKDTAIHFPEVPGGIAVEGAGYGGGTAAAFDWLTTAPHLFYWGDMDAHGYEILNGFRDAGLRVTSILMDWHAYDEFETYGTHTDANGLPLMRSNPKPLPHLTADEQTVYRWVTDPTHRLHRRIEQERIPLDRALHLVLNRVQP